MYLQAAQARVNDLQAQLEAAGTAAQQAPANFAPAGQGEAEI